MDLRKIITKELKKQKISQMQLASACNLHYQTIGLFLSGKTSMTSENLEKVLDFLRIKIT